MKYEKPELDVVNLEQCDIVTLSGEGNIDAGTGASGGWVPNNPSGGQ